MASPIKQAKFDIKQKDKCVRDAIAIAVLNHRNSDLGYVLRLHDVHTENYNDLSFNTTAETHIELTAYPIDKITPKGAWILDRWDFTKPNGRKFVLKKNFRARFHFNINEAVSAYARRKRSQLRICLAGVHKAENALIALGMNKTSSDVF